MRRLGDEHIIPEGLGGRIILPEACCQKCETTASHFEGSVTARQLLPLRTHLGLPTKRKKGRPTTLPVTLYFDDREETAEIPIEDHPAVVAVFRMSPPSLLGSDDGIGDRQIVATYIPTKAEVDRRLARLTEKYQARLVRTFAVLGDGEFKLLLAKIAHAYLTAELGYGSFEPFLLRHIERKDPNLRLFVGSALQENIFNEAERSGAQHLLKQEIVQRGNKNLCVVHIQMFVDINMRQVYSVVAGRLFDP